MANPKAAWGIEIGAHAIKAIRLERNGDEVSVADFAVIPHKKVLTTPDLDQDEMIRLGLGQFISQKSLEGEHLVMSVPGHTAFARFAKLPPVDPKKVPDIVKFEAVQQIPFPIDEVEWDYQTFTSKDSPEIEVGIFAITRERVQQRLGLYAELGLTPEVMTLSPVAVHNAMAFDHANTKHAGPVVFLDIGTQATDVIVAEGGRCWIRTFPLGGTHFTEAIANAFKLSYTKAEKLKLEASDSKYAKQIMQAMRPVFSDLLQDLQRSIGYYQSLHRESELKLMIGLGSTFKIPGLRKFLGQQLQIDVLRLDEYKRIQVTGREAAAFAENAVNMATAYGLALQGIGLAPIDANLVPVKALRDTMWAGKTKWFAAAATIAIVGSGTLLYRPIFEEAQMEAVQPAVVKQVIDRGKELQQKFEELKNRSDVGATAANMVNLFDYRTVWPFLLHDSANALASSLPQPALLGDNVEAILGIDPKVRKLIQLDKLEGEYVPPDGNAARRIKVTMNVQLSHDRPEEFLDETVIQWLRNNAEPKDSRANVPYRIIAESIQSNVNMKQTMAVGEKGDEAVARRAGGHEGGAPPPAMAAAPPRRAVEDRGGGGGAGQLRGAAPIIRAPGSEGGGELAHGTGGGQITAPVSPNRSVQPPPPGVRPPGPDGRAPAEMGVADLDRLAPVPLLPRLYPPNSTYYLFPITFEVELIDPHAPMTPANDAAAGNVAGNGAAS